MIHRAFALSTLLGLTACGARSALVEPTIDAGITMDSGTPGGERSCLPTCTVGHECCAGDCDGPAVPMPSDCCACLPGEIDSSQCPDAVCGG